MLAQLGYVLAAELVAARLADLDADARSAALVAERDGRVVGLLTLHIVPVVHEPGGWCRITALVVDEAARRAGAGRALVSAAEAFARDGELRADRGDERPAPRRARTSSTGGWGSGRCRSIS